MEEIELKAHDKPDLLSPSHSAKFIRCFEFKVINLQLKFANIDVQAIPTKIIHREHFKRGTRFRACSRI